MKQCDLISHVVALDNPELLPLPALASMLAQESFLRPRSLELEITQEIGVGGAALWSHYSFENEGVKSWERGNPACLCLSPTWWGVGAQSSHSWSRGFMSTYFVPGVTPKAEMRFSSPNRAVNYT